VYSSIKLIKEALAKIPAGEISAKGPLTLKKNAYAIGIAEGWRGDVVYFVSTDVNGEVSRVAVRDASFISWNLIPHCAPGNVLLDFPLINKSFNLSYTGYDR
jgi:Ni,Fe-hydrogenase III large subunit